MVGCENPSNLKQPITVIGKHKYDQTGWAVILKGADGEIICVPSNNYYGDCIGDYYKVGDTLK